ncbi:helix-turn-helix transcriptional regulator [Streptomyces griseobrunneus]
MSSRMEAGVGPPDAEGAPSATRPTGTTSARDLRTALKAGVPEGAGSAGHAPGHGGGSPRGGPVGDGSSSSAPPRDRSARNGAPGDGSSPADAPTPAPDAFPAALREALGRRGLSLERVSERLRARGIAVSQATLSSWQRGRSQPERARSLRAVEVLEEILELPGGALRSLLGPRRPRGRVAPARGESAALQVLGKDSVVEKALGERFRHFNQETGSLLIHDVVTLGERGTLSNLTTTNVLRASRAGADRALFVLSFDDEQAEPLDIRVTSGRLGEATYLKGLKSLVLEIHFGRELAKLDTTVVSYAVDVSPSREPATHYERWSRANLHEYLQQVFFHPDALPSGCRRYFRDQVGSPPRGQRPISMNDSHSTHVLVSRCKPGVHGVAWDFGTPE